MQRRDFLKTGALAGGAALVGGCGERPSPQPQPEPAPQAAAGEAPWQEPAFEHAEATIADLAK